MGIVALLIKNKGFRNQLVKFASDLTRPFPDGDEAAKMEYVLSDSKGRKYYKYIRDEWLPCTRFEQMQIRLYEIESRISRETLELFAANLEKAANKGNMVLVGQLAGELNVRLEALYDPELFMKFLCGLLIREDQIKTPHIWNATVEREKFEQLMKDNEGGKLSFFFRKLNLTKHVKFSTSSDSGSDMTERLLTEEIIQNQLKEVRLFDEMLRNLSRSLEQKLPS